MYILEMRREFSKACRVLGLLQRDVAIKLLLLGLILTALLFITLRALVLQLVIGEDVSTLAESTRVGIAWWTPLTFPLRI